MKSAQLIRNEAERETYPDSPLVRTLLSNAEGVGLIPGQGAKILHALWP